MYLHRDDIEDIYFTGALTSPNKTDFYVDCKGEDDRKEIQPGRRDEQSTVKTKATSKASGGEFEAPKVEITVAVKITDMLNEEVLETRRV